MDRLPEDRELLEAFRRAEPAALQRVYRAYVQEVAVFLRSGFNFSSEDRNLRFLGYSSPADLQDALQEVFINALGETSRRQYNGLTPFKNYLFGIARNVVLGTFRRDLTRVSRFQQADSETAEVVARIPSPDPTPDEVVLRAEVQKIVERFMDELSEEQREVVRLHLVEHQSQEDTAATLQINRNRVRKQVAIIRKRLLKRIRKAGLDEPGAAVQEALEVKS